MPELSLADKAAAEVILTAVDALAAKSHAAGYAKAEYDICRWLEQVAEGSGQIRANLLTAAREIKAGMHREKEGARR